MCHVLPYQEHIYEHVWISEKGCIDVGYVGSIELYNSGHLVILLHVSVFDIEMNIVVRLLDNGYIELLIGGTWYTLSPADAIKLRDDLGYLLEVVSQQLML